MGCKPTIILILIILGIMLASCNIRREAYPANVSLNDSSALIQTNLSYNDTAELNQTEEDSWSGRNISPEYNCTIQSCEHPVKIAGESKNCTDRAQKALDILKDKAVAYYDVVVQYAGLINCSSLQGVYVYRGDFIYVSDSRPLTIPPSIIIDAEEIKKDNLYFAHRIVHEACHLKQYYEYMHHNFSRGWSTTVNEIECLLIEINATKHLLKKNGTEEEFINKYVSDFINEQIYVLQDRFVECRINTTICRLPHLLTGEKID